MTFLSQANYDHSSAYCSLVCMIVVSFIDDINHFINIKGNVVKPSVNSVFQSLECSSTEYFYSKSARLCLIRHISPPSVLIISPEKGGSKMLKMLRLDKQIEKWKGWIENRWEYIFYWAPMHHPQQQSINELTIAPHLARASRHS